MDMNKFYCCKGSAMYKSHDLIGPYHLWGISPRNSTDRFSPADACGLSMRLSLDYLPVFWPLSYDYWLPQKTEIHRHAMIRKGYYPKCWVPMVSVIEGFHCTGSHKRPKSIMIRKGITLKMTVFGAYTIIILVILLAITYVIPCPTYVHTYMYVHPPAPLPSHIHTHAPSLVPTHSKDQRERLVHTVCTCIAPQVFLGNLETSVKSTLLY